MQDLNAYLSHIYFYPVNIVCEPQASGKLPAAIKDFQSMLTSAVASVRRATRQTRAFNRSTFNHIHNSEILKRILETAFLERLRTLKMRESPFCRFQP